MRDPNKARQTKYAKEWFDHFGEHWQELTGKVDIQSNGTIAQTNRNTQLVAQVVLETFKDMGDFAGIMGTIAMCKNDLVNEPRKVIEVKDG